MNNIDVRSVSHAGIVVQDVDVVGDFFERILGLHRLYDHSSTGTRLRGLAIDDVLVELIEYPGDHPMQFRSAGTPRAHVAFTVADLDVAHRQALDLGIEIIAEPKDVGVATYLYLQGPEQVIVELVEYQGGHTRSTQLFTEIEPG